MPQASVHGLKQNMENPQKSTLGKKNYDNFEKKIFMENASKMIEWKHRHVTYQIEANDETNTMRVI